MPLPIALIVLAPTPRQIMDASIAAFKKRRNFSVGILMDSNYQGMKEHHTYELAYQYPDRLLMTRLEAGKPDLLFWLDNKTFVGYDPQSNEKVVRAAPPQGPIVNRLANMLGGLQDVVAAQLSPDTMEAFIHPFRDLSGWSMSRSGDALSLVRAGKISTGATKTRLTFSASSGLMTEALLQGPGSRLLWSYRYHATPRAVGYSIPSSAKSVRALFEHIDIKGADPKARGILDSALKAYAQVSNIAFTIDGTDRKSSIWVGASSFRERQPKLDWVYTRGVLSIQTFWDGKVYRGACKPNAIASYLRVLKQPMEPMLQAFIVQRNPLNAWLHPSLKIRAKGTVKLGSVVADAVEMASPYLSISLLIRRDTHLIANVASRSLDGKGGLVGESTRAFTYTSVGKPLSPATFKLPAKKYLPLAAIK